MKKVIVFLVLILLSSPSFSQVVVDPGASEIGVAVKRTHTEGQSVVIDLMVTCYASAWRRIGFGDDKSSVYDDEGNLYRLGSGSIVIQGDNSWGELQVEKDIPRKMKVIVKNVDEYATAFPLIKLYYSASGDNGGIKQSLVTIKNLPIQRQ